MQILNDDEFYEASLQLEIMWVIIDSRLLTVNTNLGMVRAEWWRVIRNLKLLAKNREQLKLVNAALRGNMALIAAREVYVMNRAEGI